MADTQEELLRKIIESLDNSAAALNQSAQAQLEAAAAQTTDTETQDRLRRISENLASSPTATNLSQSRSNASRTAADLAEIDGVLGKIAAGATQAGTKAEKFFEILEPRPDLLATMNKIQERFGGIAGEQGRAFREGESFASQYAHTLLDLDKKLRGADSSVGSFEASLSDLFGGPDAAFAAASAAYREMIEGSISSADGLITLKSATSDTALEMALFGKQMDLNAKQTQTFVSRMIDLTGEASSEMLRESAVYAKRVADVTGDSSKEILTIMEQIVRESEDFGNVLPDEAAKIAGSLRQLGIDFKDFHGMQQKFLNFESAARSVSALTSVFGVQLDAMEMMELANEDQFTFLMRMRDQFLATAGSVDDMSQAELRLIQQQLSLSSESAVRRLLDPDATISDISDLEDATGDAVGTTEDALDELETQVLKFGRIAKGTVDDYAAEMSAAAHTHTQTALLDMSTQYQEFYSDVVGMHQRAVADTADRSGIPATLEDAMESYPDQIMGPIKAGLKTATDEIFDAVTSLFEDLNAWLQENFPGFGHSPSEWGLSMLYGITEPMAMMEDIVANDFRGLDGIAVDAFKSIVRNAETMAGKTSAAIGALGVEFTDLTETQIGQYIDRFNLGEGQEAVDKLKVMMRAHADDEAIALRDKADSMQVVLENLVGRSPEYIESRIAKMADENDLSVEVLRGAMGEGAEAKNMIFNALKGKQAADAEQAAEGQQVAANVTEEQERTTAAVGQLSEYQRAMVEVTGRNHQQLTTLNTKLDTLITSTKELVGRPVEVTANLVVDAEILATSVATVAASDSGARSSGSTGMALAVTPI